MQKKKHDSTLKWKQIINNRFYLLIFYLRLLFTFPLTSTFQNCLCCKQNYIQVTNVIQRKGKVSAIRFGNGKKMRTSRFDAKTSSCNLHSCIRTIPSFPWIPSENLRMTVALATRSRRTAQTTNVRGKRRAFRINEGVMAGDGATLLLFPRRVRTPTTGRLGETCLGGGGRHGCGGGYLRAGIIEGATALRDSFYHRVSHRRRNRARVLGEIRPE